MKLHSQQNCNMLILWEFWDFALKGMNKCWSMSICLTKAWTSTSLLRIFLICVYLINWRIIFRNTCNNFFLMVLLMQILLENLFWIGENELISSKGLLKVFYISKNTHDLQSFIETSKLATFYLTSKWNLRFQILVWLKFSWKMNMKQIQSELLEHIK